MNDNFERIPTTNCAVCGVDTESQNMLCDECQADADHDKFVDDCYNAQYDESMY